MLVISRICILRLELPNKLLLSTYKRKATVYPLKPGPPRELKPIWWYNWNNRLWCTFYGAQGGRGGGVLPEKIGGGVMPTFTQSMVNVCNSRYSAGFVPFSQNKFPGLFQDSDWFFLDSKIHINPCTPKISMLILLTVCHTFQNFHLS